MNLVLRLMALLLLMLVAIMTFARRENSGAWIVFGSGFFYDEHIALMTGDGSQRHVVTPGYLCAMEPNWSGDGHLILFTSRGCNGSPQGYMEIPPGAGHARPYQPTTTDAPLSDRPRVLVNTGIESDEMLVSTGANQMDVVPLPMQRLGEPSYSPDGEWIAFVGGERGRFHIYRMRPDGRDLQQLTDEPNNYYNLRWSPDGDWLLYVRLMERIDDILRIRADGSKTQLLATGFSPRYAPESGRVWHPFLGIIAAAGLIILSFMGRLRR